MVNSDKKELEKLGKKIENYKASKKEENITPLNSKVSASNIVIEMLSGVVAGGIFGYLLGELFGGRAYFMLVCIILGFVASMLIIYRMISKN